MKKLILDIVKFFIFSTLFYLILLICTGKILAKIPGSNFGYKVVVGGFMKTKLEDVKNRKNIDILFLGSSHAYRSFDTRFYAKKGFSSFNLGGSALTPIQTKMLLKRYLNNLNPKIVFFEVYPETFIIDGLESSLDIISNGESDLQTINMMNEYRNIKLYNTFMYSEFMRFSKLDTQKEPLKYKEDTYIPGGFVERKMKYFHYTLGSQDKVEIKFNEKQFSAFKEIMLLLKQKNIKTYLVFAPITKMKYQGYSNVPYFDSLMSTFSKYYNFNNISNFDDSLHFYDDNHLNQVGANKFNTEIFEKVLTCTQK